MKKNMILFYAFLLAVLSFRSLYAETYLERSFSEGNFNPAKHSSNVYNGKFDSLFFLGLFGTYGGIAYTYESNKMHIAFKDEFQKVKRLKLKILAHQNKIKEIKVKARIIDNMKIQELSDKKKLAKLGELYKTHQQSLIKSRELLGPVKSAYKKYTKEVMKLSIKDLRLLADPADEAKFARYLGRYFRIPFYIFSADIVISIILESLDETDADEKIREIFLSTFESLVDNDDFEGDLEPTY